MGGIINNPQFQNVMDPARPGQPQVPFGQQPGFGQQPVQMPQKPGQPFQMTLPDHYQSPFASYGFDPGLQSYLDQQMYRYYTDGGVGYQYDPTNQTFTGGTRMGQYNPIPLNVMQQAAGGNSGVLQPYYQSRYPGVSVNAPQGQSVRNPQSPITPYGPEQLAFLQEKMQGQPTRPQMPQRPQTQLFNPMNRPQQPQGPQQRGLGGLQLNKFRNKLG